MIYDDVGDALALFTG